MNAGCFPATDDAGIKRNVNFLELVQHFVANTLDVSLPAFLPELTLCVTIVLMLLVRVVSWNGATDRLAMFAGSWLPLVGALVALYFARPWAHLEPGGSADTEIFSGLLIYDGLTIYARAFLAAFLVLFVIFTQLSGIPDREDGADFYTLVLGSTVGMCLMASANHLFIVFLAVEMASVPSYALSGILKGRRQSSEAAIKYAVYGAGTAGIMLYGISLLSGALGTAHLPTMAVQLAGLIDSGAGSDRYMVLALGGLMVMVGIAFKLSAVPFHFWCPDVFEGASAEVNAFLSVASKGAALILLVRVAMGLGSIPERTLSADSLPPAQTAMAAGKSPAVLPQRDNDEPAARLAAHRLRELAAEARRPAAAEPAVRPTSQEAAAEGTTAAPLPSAADRARLIEQLSPVRRFMLMLVTIVSAITCTFGNWTAYGQTNIKRLLAYSTIAHAGYMMMPVAAALAAIGTNDTAARDAIGYLGFYIGAYLFMNLGAFAIVAFLRNATRSEEIADYAGIFWHSPVVVICFSIILVSLIGIPPLAGFMAKFAIFASLVETEQYALLLIGGLNTVLSLFYYLRVVWVMSIEPEPEHRAPFSLSAISLEGVFVILVTAPVVTLGIWGDWLFRWTHQAASQLLS